MFPETSEEYESSDPVQVRETPARECIVGFTIDVLGLVLLQTMGLQGIIPHIVVAAVIRGFEYKRTRSGG